jgi:hypothetical protein
LTLGPVAIAMYQKGCGGEMNDENDRSCDREPWVVASWYPDRSLPCWQGILIRWVAADKRSAIEWCDRNLGFFTMSASLANILLEQTQRPTFRRIESPQIENN